MSEIPIIPRIPGNPAAPDVEELQTTEGTFQVSNAKLYVCSSCYFIYKRYH